MNRYGHTTARRARQRLPVATIIEWALCFLSFSMLLAVAAVGTAAAALFLLPWAWIALKARGAAVEAVVRNGWLLVLPAYALLSTAWSDSPETTFRFAIQYGLTTVIAIWVGTLIRPKIMLSALLATMMFIVILSIAVGKQGVDGATGEVALVGIFESKNQLAICAVIYLFSSITVIIDKSQPTFMRLLGMLGLPLAPFVLLSAKSAGSLVACFPGLAMLLITWGITALPRGNRGLVIATGVVLAALMALAITSAMSVGGFLDFLGKDASLTGRTELWDRALQYIDERPILGNGFQAFWREDNPRAQYLWVANHVPIGSGFNFHNVYLNISVDLGLIGLLLVLFMLAGIATRLVIALFAEPGPAQFFAVGVFGYLLTISIAEVIFPYQFHFGTVLFNMVWCYLAPVGQRRPGTRSDLATRWSSVRAGNQPRRWR